MSDAVPSLWGGGHASISGGGGSWSGGSGVDIGVGVGTILLNGAIRRQAYHEVSQHLELVDRGEPGRFWASRRGR